MRILEVIPTYLPATRYGGPILSTHALAKALVERGNRVEVYTTYGGQNGKSGRLPPAITEIDGVTVNYFLPDRMPRLSWAPKLAHKLKTEIRNFDIVHLHTVFQWPTWKAAQLARTHGIPYIISPRGMLVQDLIRRRNRLVKSVWNQLIEKKNLKLAAAIHVTSAREAADLENLNWNLPKLVNIPNGVEWLEPEGSVSPEIRDIANRLPYALFFGRLTWKKGLDTLLHAFAGTGLGYLVIAGTDDEGLSNSLRQLAGKLGIEQRVHIVARTVSGVDRYQLFRSARMFVLPSYSENFGNVVLEALASQLPVIVTPEVGAAEIVLEADAGFVVPKDPIAIGSRIESLMLDEQAAKRMGTAGQQYVGKNCSWHSVAASMEQLYQTCASEASRSHTKSN